MSESIEKLYQQQQKARIKFLTWVAFVPLIVPTVFLALVGLVLALPFLAVAGIFQVITILLEDEND